MDRMRQKKNEEEEDLVAMNVHHEKDDVLGPTTRILRKRAELNEWPEHSESHLFVKSSGPPHRWKAFLWNLVFILIAAISMGLPSSDRLEDVTVSDTLPGSVYIPGAGFAGFWYHFGFFSYQQQRHNESGRQQNSTQETNHHLNNTYYCYSSGCLAYIFAAATLDVDTVLTSAERVQQQWFDGQLHRYDVVPQFLQELLPPFPRRSKGRENMTTLHSHASPWDAILSRLRILVTVVEPRKSILLNTQELMRPRVHTPTCHSTLIQYLQATTHIPWLTGPLSQSSASDEVVLDGGFSRLSHPPCNHRIRVPITWLTMVHSLNPGLDAKHAKELFYHGMADAALVTS